MLMHKYMGTEGRLAEGTSLQRKLMEEICGVGSVVSLAVGHKMHISLLQQLIGLMDQ